MASVKTGRGVPGQPRPDKQAIVSKNEGERHFASSASGSASTTNGSRRRLRGAAGQSRVAVVIR